MPLVAHCDLPSFAVLHRQGAKVVALRRQDRVSFRIGLLNLMPDAVLQATERQFMRLVAGYVNADVYVYPCAVATEHRGEAAQAHIAQYYESFESLQCRGLDALIVTGADPRDDDMTREPFWKPMMDAIAWARHDECPVLCSCLAVHAVLHVYFDTHRVLLPKKRWGVYPHRPIESEHLLVKGVESGWAAPHSHRYDVSREQMEQVGVRVLVHGDEAGVYLAVSDDQSPFVFFQGHPEYDAHSLLKEYKREVSLYFDGSRSDYPPFPENYFPVESLATLENYKRQLLEAKQLGLTQPEFPECELKHSLTNCWAASGERVFHNWMRQIQLSKE